MTEKFEDIFLNESGCLWRGKVRAGVTGITAVCRKLDAPGITLYKDRPKVRAGAVDGFFVKRYNLPGLFIQIRRRFKKPRPSIVLAGAEKLFEIGIATPAVCAALLCDQGFCRSEYLVCELLDEKCRMLNQLDENECRQFIYGKFIKMLRQMHDAGMSHGDLSLRNCYISADGEAGLLDLDGSYAGAGELSVKKRTLELGRLISGFLLQYRKISEAGSCTAEMVKIYGGGVRFEAVFKAVNKFIRRGKKYL